MSSKNSETPAKRTIPTRRELLTGYLLGHSNAPLVRNYVLARALDRLDLNQLEQLTAEVEHTFYGDSPDWSALIDRLNSDEKQ